MRVNDKELIATSFKPSTIEGRINYKTMLPGKSSKSFKEYWFKLTGNLLFYFSLNSFGGIKGNEPVGVMILENMTVSFDEEGAGLFAFVVVYAGDSEKHVFSCFSVLQAQNWVVALRQASIEHLRIQVKILENKLESLGGKSIFSWNNTSLSKSETELFPPIAPPRTKTVGPKTNTFVSHMPSLEKSLANNHQDQNGNSGLAEDLIRW